MLRALGEHHLPFPEVAERQAYVRQLRCEAGDPDDAIDAVQDGPVGQKTPKPILIGGYCRAENVTCERNAHFGLHADVCYTDGTWLWGQCVPFRTGTHDWEAREVRVEPAQPVRLVRSHTLMREGHTGHAWFDDVSVREVGGGRMSQGRPEALILRPRLWFCLSRDCRFRTTQARSAYHRQ